MNIYIACALTHVPREIFHEYSNWIHSLAKGLSQNNNVKYALINSDPELSKRPEGVLGIFRPKTTKCSGGRAVRGLQRG
ncbi:hypothetical protein, partial [Escherichia coli]|uniref:hypothetical protein n=1 Tax=Escherichia coli TaxID=562 RepID=UPI00292BF520